MTDNFDRTGWDVVEKAEPITGFRAFAVYASYDGNAPDTDNLLYVAGKTQAVRLCHFLNQDPRRWTIAQVDGLEHCKRFVWREAIVADPEDDVYATIGEAVDGLLEDEDYRKARMES